jgi:hypothetical protein
MKTDKKEALELFEDHIIHSIIFVNVQERNEFVDFFSFKELISRYEGASSSGKIYSELNLFLNQLPLYSLDSFLNDFNSKRQELVIIGHTLCDKKHGIGFEYSILNEAGELIELIRDDLIRLIAEKEEKLIKPFITEQLKKINQESKTITDQNMEKYVNYFFGSVKSIFSFNKLSSKEIAQFSLSKADPNIIRKQMLAVIEQTLI